MNEILISSSVLILILTGARLLFRNKVSRRLQYALWLLVALRLLVPVSFGQSSHSVAALADRLEKGSKPVQQIQQTLQEPIAGPSRAELYEQLLNEYQEREDSGTESIPPAVRQEIESQVEQQITVPTVKEILTAIWIGGMGVMVLWFLAVNLTFLRRARQGSIPFETTAKIPVLISPNVPSPCLTGLFRPVIYLTPASVRSEESLKHIITHELVHLRHADHFWSALRCLCLCIYWFDPLVWLAAVLSRRDCELACDEAALKKLGDSQRIAYGKTLLETVTQSRSPARILETATAMNETKKQLKERVNCIVKKPKTLLIAAAILVLTAAIAAGCTFTGSKPTKPPATEPPVTEPLPTTPTIPDPTDPSSPTGPPTTQPPVTRPPVTQPPVTEPPPTVLEGVDPGEPIPTLPPTTQELYVSYSQIYRDVYYKIYTDYCDLLTDEQLEDWILYYNHIYHPQINNNEWSANRMLLVTFVQRYDISREEFDRATANFMGRLAVHDWIYWHLETEIPNADIIYTFDDEIINEYYLLDAPIYDPPPAFTVKDNSSATDCHEILPPDSIRIQDFQEDDYNFDREYREAYYRSWVGFLPLLSDSQRQEYFDWVDDFRSENDYGRDQQEMLLVAMIKQFNIPRAAFEQAVAYYISAAEAVGCDLASELYEPPNPDIIYTFDNEIINEYYRIRMDEA